jgi:hypothetical protein
VIDGGEPGLGGDLGRPLLHGPPLDFHAGAAGAADQVMVVGLAAALPVQGLPAGLPDGVHPAVLAEHLQVPVDGGQADPLPLAAQLGMDLLRAQEAGQAAEDRGQRLGLPGPAHPCAPAPGGPRISVHGLRAVRPRVGGREGTALPSSALSVAGSTLSMCPDTGCNPPPPNGRSWLSIAPMPVSCGTSRASSSRGGVPVAPADQDGHSNVGSCLRPVPRSHGWLPGR